jgi:hypothetical protein
LLFAPQLFSSRAFVIGDASSIRAFAEFSAARWLTHHERTHWNPYIFAGLPATASLQDSRPQWLPDRLLDAFDALHRLPHFPPLAIPLVVHLAGMIAMAGLARTLWRAGTPSMVWAGVAWGLLPGLLVPLAFGQDWLVMSGSLMPVILLAVMARGSATTVDGRLRAALGLSLATACLLLAAHPQIIALIIPLAAGFAWLSAHGRPARLLDLGASVGVGAAMSAAVWWPAYLYNVHSVRGAGEVVLSEVGRWSAGAPDLVALAWPWAAGFGGRTYWGGLGGTDFPQFVGSAVFALALLGLSRRDRSGGAALFLAGTALLASLLALGMRLGSFYQWIYAHVPLWSSFRVAIRILVVTQLAFALLSARGLERLGELIGRAPRRWIATAAGLAAMGLLFAALLRWGFLRETYAQAVYQSRPHIAAAIADEALRGASFDLAWRALLVSVLVAVTVTGVRVPRWRPWAAAATICLLALDLGAVSVPFLLRASGPLARIEKPPLPLIARLAEREPKIRVLDVSRERMFGNDWIRWRAHSLTGNHPAVPRIWDDLRRAQLTRSYPVLCGLAVGYLGGAEIGPPDTALFDRAGLDETSRIPVWKLKRALPRAYAVSNVGWLENDRTVLAALATPDLDPRRDVFTTEDGIAGRYPGSSSCRIRWLEDEPDHLALETVADSASFLVVADTWFTGWHATIDGQPAPIHRVQHLLRGFVLPAGRHRLRLTYEPEGWRASVIWARGAWLLWIAGAVIAAARGFRRDREVDPRSGSA